VNSIGQKVDASEPQNQDIRTFGHRAKADGDAELLSPDVPSITAAMTAPSPLSGDTIVARLKALARHTDVPGEMTRLSLSPAHRLAHRHRAGWRHL
jgi:hypothetical protein